MRTGAGGEPDLWALRTTAGADLVAIHGSPSVLLAHAHQLATLGESLAAVGRVVAGLVDSADWDGPAGAAFAATAAPLPLALDAASRRYLACGREVAAYASVLADCQQRAARAMNQHTDHVATRDRWTEAMARAEGSSDPAEQALAVGYRERALAEHDLASRARREHGFALEVWQEADHRCARALRATAQDALVDSGLYRVLDRTTAVLDGASTVVGLLALVPSPFTPALELTSDGLGAAALAVAAGVAIGYGDVTTTELTRRAGELAAPKALSVGLRNGGTMAAASGLGLTTTQRLVQGGRSALLLRTPQVVIPPPAATAALPDGLRLSERLRAKGIDAVNRRYVTDWQVAFGHGRTAAGMVVASYLVRDLPGVVSLRDKVEQGEDVARQVRGYADAAGEREQEETAGGGTR